MDLQRARQRAADRALRITEVASAEAEGRRPWRPAWLHELVQALRQLRIPPTPLYENVTRKALFEDILIHRATLSSIEGWHFDVRFEPHDYDSADNGFDLLVTPDCLRHGSVSSNFRGIGAIQKGLPRKGGVIVHDPVSASDAETVPYETLPYKNYERYFEAAMGEIISGTYRISDAGSLNVAIDR